MTEIQGTKREVMLHGEKPDHFEDFHEFCEASIKMREERGKLLNYPLQLPDKEALSQIELVEQRSAVRRAICGLFMKSLKRMKSGVPGFNSIVHDNMPLSPGVEDRFIDSMALEDVCGYLDELLDIGDEYTPGDQDFDEALVDGKAGVLEILRQTIQYIAETRAPNSALAHLRNFIQPVEINDLKHPVTSLPWEAADGTLSRKDVMLERLKLLNMSKEVPKLHEDGLRNFEEVLRFFNQAANARKDARIVSLIINLKESFEQNFNEFTFGGKLGLYYKKKVFSELMCGIKDQQMTMNTMGKFAVLCDGIVYLISAFAKIKSRKEFQDCIKAFIITLKGLAGGSQEENPFRRQK